MSELEARRAEDRVTALERAEEPTAAPAAAPDGDGQVSPPARAPVEGRGRNHGVSVTAEGFVCTGERTSALTLIREVWASRRLLAILARKDFYVKYRRASFGLFWAIGVPLFQTAILAIVFSRVVRVRTAESYPVFVFAGQLGWSFFNSVLGTASTAIVDGAGLSSRIYFPRAVLVIKTVVTQLYSFAISVAILLVAALLFGVSLGPEVLLVVPGTILLVVLTTSLSLLAAGIHVYFRDIRYIIGALLSAWFFVTPVIYPLELAPRSLEIVLRLNPVSGIIELFRAATVGADPGWLTTVWVSCGWSLVLLVAALVVHTRFNRVFADLL